MSELSMSTAKKTPLLCAEGSYLPLFLLFFCCFLISELNFLHFLSPLLFTTFIVFLFTSYNTTFIDNPLPGPNNAGDHDTLEEDHEVYKIFFEAPSHFELLHQEDDDTTELESEEELVDKFLICVNDPAQDQNPPLENDQELFQEKHEHQSCDVLSEKDQAVKEIDTDNSRIVVLPGSKEESETDMEVNDKECVSRTVILLEEKSSSNKVEYEKTMSMRSYGSMRVEKEWKRTLACKLFEERHNNGGDDNEEGMDLLWEAYEDTNTTFSAKHDNNNSKKLEKKRSVKSSSYKDMDEVEDDEEVMGGKICCLQALKFSAGKVNMGMGRPNIGRISKAFRGMGWLHHLTTKKASSSLRH